MMHWSILAVAIVVEVIATTALKSSDGFTRLWPSMLVVAGYSTAIYLLSLTLEAIPVGIVYAVWSGVGIVLIAITATLFLGQRLDVPAMLGMALIISGVVVIHLFSQVSVH
ncbi:MAG TPA: SMR family transporter [Nitrospiraceae bacterium]|nr:SMR family transporter [Nitrospiraceae bacterium]